MSKTMRSCGCVMAVALLLCGGAAMAQDYEIKLSRPEKVGNKYLVTCTGQFKQSQSVAMAGQPAQKQEEAYQVDFKAVEEILAVSDNGRPTKVSYTIDRAQKITGEQKTDLVAKGKVLMQEFKETEAEMSVDGKKLEDADAGVLSLAVSDMDPNGPQIEEIIGTKDRQKVGGTWKADSEALAKAMNKGGKLSIKPEDLTASCKLAEVKKVDDVECLQIECQMLAKNVGLGGMPDGGQKPDKSELTVNMSGAFPTDGKVAAVAQKMTMTMNVAMTVKADGGDAKVGLVIDRSADVKRTPQK